VKAASDVYAPCAGEVVEVNAVSRRYDIIFRVRVIDDRVSYFCTLYEQALEDSPGKVNESPLDQGWFIKIKLSAQGKTDLGKLLDEAAYKKHTEEAH
jgi:glycine cleavage system H protein